MEIAAIRKVKLIKERFGHRRFPTDPLVCAVSISDADGLDAEARGIVDAIRREFATRPIPRFDPLEGEIEYATLRGSIGGVSWDEADALSLVTNLDWLIALQGEPPLFNYYLPAYLTTYLVHWPRVLTLWGHEGENPSFPYFEEFVREFDLTNYRESPEFFTRLSRTQRNCVARFLAFYFKYSALLYGEIEFTLRLAALESLWSELL